jgi:hypothetical protein
MDMIYNNESLVSAIMEINKYIKPEIKDHSIVHELMVAELTRLKDYDEIMATIIDRDYGSSLGFICSTITSIGWLNIGEEVQFELYKFTLEIRQHLDKKYFHKREGTDLDILNTLRIYRQLLKNDHRLSE